MNAILAIHPYKSNGLWVFDDEKAGLVQEPFVSGADTIIELMVRDMPTLHAACSASVRSEDKD